MTTNNLGKGLVITALLVICIFMGTLYNSMFVANDISNANADNPIVTPIDTNPTTEPEEELPIIIRTSFPKSAVFSPSSEFNFVQNFGGGGVDNICAVINGGNTHYIIGETSSTDYDFMGFNAVSIFIAAMDKNNGTLLKTAVCGESGVNRFLAAKLTSSGILVMGRKSGKLNFYLFDISLNLIKSTYIDYNSTPTKAILYYNNGSTLVAVGDGSDTILYSLDSTLNITFERNLNLPNSTLIQMLPSLNGYIIMLNVASTTNYTRLLAVDYFGNATSYIDIKSDNQIHGIDMVINNLPTTSSITTIILDGDSLLLINYSFTLQLNFRTELGVGTGGAILPVANGLLVFIYGATPRTLFVCSHGSIILSNIEELVLNKYISSVTTSDSTIFIGTNGNKISMYEYTNSLSVRKNISIQGGVPIAVVGTSPILYINSSSTSLPYISSFGSGDGYALSLA